ncbi:MAG TPA: hypothetical protein VM243_20290 [Phycisphaerae bacterium]|nr:hypothetical protein [Phycisphaerae bacterium]
MRRRHLILPLVVLAWAGPRPAPAQQIEIPVSTEEQPAERPPDAAEGAFPAPADLKDALDRATAAVRAAEERGPDAGDKLQEAEFYVQTALSMEPANPRAEFLNGRMNILIGRSRDAYTQISNYAASDGSADWEAFKVLGDLHLQGKYYVLAEAKYKQALELNPTNVSVLIGLAQCANARAKRAEAIEYATRALRLDNTSAEAYDAYAAAQSAQGNLEEARQAIRAAIALTQTAMRERPDDVALLTKLYTRFGTLQKNLDSLRLQASAPGSDPNMLAERTLEFVETVQARTEVARVLAMRQLTDLLERAIKQDKSGPPPKLVYKLAQLALITEQHEPAIELLEEVLAVDGADARALELLDELRAAAAAESSAVPAQP